METKLVKEHLYWVTIGAKYTSTTLGIVADSMEEALNLAKLKLVSDDVIKEVRDGIDIYRKSTKTITVEV